MTIIEQSNEHHNIDAIDSNIILDTHILIWYLQGSNLTERQIQLIDCARSNNNLFISAISFWEIAMLVQKEKIAFSMSLNELIEKITAITGLQILELTIEVLIESTMLQNYEYRDPADRMIISSCRHHDLYLMTHDQRILEYAQKGYLKIADNLRD